MTTLAYINNPDGTPVSPQAPQATAPVTSTPTPVAPVQTAPVAPVATPTAPVSPTLSVNQQQRADNIESRQANSFPVQAPSQISTPQQADLQYTNNPDGAPVSPLATPTPVKNNGTPTVAPVLTTEQRSSEILSHLNEGLTRSPGLFKDINTYRNAYGYNQKSPAERSILDNFFESSKPTTDSYLSAMIGGTATQGNNTPEFRQATTQFRNISPYIHATDPTQLINAVSTGKIGSSDITTIQKYNPALYQAYQKKQAVYNQANSINNSILNTPVKTASMDTILENVSNSAVSGIHSGLYDAYKSFIQTDPRIISSYKGLEDAEKKVNEYNNEKAKARADIENTYGNTLTDGAKSALLAKRVNNLDITYGDPNANRTTAISALQNAITVGGFGYFKDDYDNTVGERQKLQATADFNKKQAEQALQDPATAIKSVIDEMSKIGVSSTESLQTKIQKANEYIAKGGTLAGYIDQMKKLYTDKPEYKAYLAKQSGTEWQSTNITRYNPSTGANESTPIFYRKKTSGGFEAVDLSGNPIDASAIGGGGGNTPGTLPTSFTGDTTSYIASKEGFRDKAYQDSAGVWTIGYGTTKINGKAVQPGQTITQADAQAQLGADIAKHSNWKNFIDENTLSSSQKTALASFEYNLGPGIWNKSAMNIIDMIKSGDLSSAGKEIQKYNQAGGKVVKGLQNRRAEEAKLLQSTGNSTTPTAQSNPLQVKEFEAYNGTTIPAQYKTPLEQDDFVKRYNEWRGSRPGTKIETGNDILNIRLDKGGTEGEKVSQSYTSRMLNAVNSLIPLEQKYASLTLAEQLKQQYLPTVLKSDEQKLIDLNKKNFITAVLRKQSGASIAPSEFTGEEMKYFPQPGDSREVIVAKQNARNAEIKAMLATAGTDAEGNSISKYYNPSVIIAESTTGESIEQRLARLRNKK